MKVCGFWLLFHLEGNVCLHFVLGGYPISFHQEYSLFQRNEWFDEASNTLGLGYSQHQTYLELLVC